MSEGIFFIPKGSLSDAESSSLVLVNWWNPSY
jgi:hypothetical protein